MYIRAKRADHVKPSNEKPFPDEIPNHGCSFPFQIQISDSITIIIVPEYNRYSVLGLNI